MMKLLKKRLNTFAVTRASTCNSLPITMSNIQSGLGAFDPASGEPSSLITFTC